MKREKDEKRCEAKKKIEKRTEEKRREEKRREEKREKERKSVADNYENDIIFREEVRAFQD